MRLSLSALALVACSSLPLMAGGVHFNGDVFGGRFDPAGSVSFAGSNELIIGRNYKLNKGPAFGANIYFDVGHINFGVGGMQSSYKQDGAPEYGFTYNGVRFNTSDFLSNKLNVTQYHAFVSYEWDLTKYVPGVALQTGPMLQAVKTDVTSEVINLTRGTRSKQSQSATALAIGGRIHLGFVKDLLALDGQVAFSVGGSKRYHDFQARFSVHPVPFFNFGVGYRDNRAESRGDFSSSGYASNDQFDVGQKGFIAFLGWRIGMGGR